MKTILTLAAACLLAAGCQRSLVTQPLPTRQADGAAQMNFWRDLADARLIGNDEAFHALILWNTGKDAATSYDQRVAWLQQQGDLPAGFHAGANEAVERGTVAAVLASMIHLQGGVTMHVLGPGNPRYATRELVWNGVFPPSTPQQGISGIEFVGVLSRAEAYMETRS